MYLPDIFNLIKDKLTLKQQSVLNNIFKEYIDNVDLAFNHHYSYLKLCRDDIYYEICDAIIRVYEDYFIPDNNANGEFISNIILTFSRLAYEYISDWCNELEDFGYEYLYEISDEDMQEISKDNDWYYLENGEFYCN